MTETTRHTITFSCKTLDAINKHLEGIHLSSVSSTNLGSSSLLFSILCLSAEIYVSKSEIIDVTFKTNLRRFESDTLDFSLDVGSGKSNLNFLEKDLFEKIKKKYIKILKNILGQLTSFIVLSSNNEEPLFYEDGFIHHLME